MAVVGIGAHLGLAAALYGTKIVRYNKDPVDCSADRLFEKVYSDYTREYAKGPKYWCKDKLQGFHPDYPGSPLFRNGKLTSESLGNLKGFTSNELAFFSVLFFAMGLYGCLMFNIYDPQWAKVEAGEWMNATYIVLSYFLLPSFYLHIGAYIQKKNGM